jgi:hypothetical protein
MKTNLLVSLVLGAALFVSGCTRSGPQVVQVESPQANPGESKEDKKPEINTTVLSNGDGQAAVVLDERELKSAYAIDTANMTFKFEYLGKTQQGPITFVANKATLQFKDLPSEQSGTVKLELLEAGVVKLTASQENVTLKKGVPNQISLKLVSTANPITNPSTTDLSIDVTLDEKPIPDTTPIKPVDPVLPDPVKPDPIQPDPADPIASWNGKEHKGNSRWSIISVD